MTISYQPANAAAQALLSKAEATIDRRLAFDEDEKRDVLSLLLANSHKTVLCTGHKKLTDALLGEVLGRDAGRARFFVKPAYRDPEAQWRTLAEEPNFPFHPRTKGGCWFRCSEASKTLVWDEIAGLGFGPAHFLKPVDFEATVGAFRAGYAPSVNFTSCDHPNDYEGAVAFSNAVSEGARLQGVPLVQIADGWVCDDLTRGLRAFSIETTRFFNRAGLRFCFKTTDRYGRQEVAWGAFG